MAVIRQYLVFFVCMLSLCSCKQNPASPFEEAQRSIAEGDAIGLSKILTKNPSIVYEKTNYNNSTLLHLASSYGSFEEYEEMINLLLSAGSDVNAKNDEGRTPAHLLCYFGIDGYLLLPLLEIHGADLTIVDAYGKKPKELINHSEK